jgi:amidase
VAGFADYDDFDATGLAQLVAKREVTPLQLVEAAIERVEARNEKLNAVVHRSFARARARAEAMGAELGALARDVGDLPPFLGVPFLLKDLGAEDQGQPSTGSTKLRAGFRAATDCELVHRFKSAGLIVIGRTNTPEFGIMGITESEFRGPCRNPWHLWHTPGGSSGGAGAAVAARLVPMAHAGDGGGSIRIPASHCGLVGLKPTRGRNPMGPDASERWLGLVSEHVVARSVRDVAGSLDAISGPELGAPYELGAPERPYVQELGRDTGRLRIGYCRETLFGGETDGENLAGLEATVQICRDLGHELIETKPDYDRQSAVRAYLLIVAANIAIAMDEASEGRPRARDFERATWLLKMIADAFSAREYQRAIDTIRETGRRVARSLDGFDAFLTPTCARPPVRVGEFDMSRSEKLQATALENLPVRPKGVILTALDSMAGRRLQATPNTGLFNLTGQPAISLPLHWTDEGLPVGMQFVGRFGDEATLLRLSAQIERAHPWIERRPAYIG